MNPDRRTICSKVLWESVVLLFLVSLNSCYRYEPYAEVLTRIERKEFVEINGQRVHFKEWGRPSKGRPPLVLLHGLGSSAHEFREIGPLLGRNRWVLAPDLNGFGYTERMKEKSHYGMQGQQRLVKNFLRHMGVTHYDLLGRSFSGDLALRIAKSEEKKVRKVVVMSPALAMSIGKYSPLRVSIFREIGYPVLPWILSNREKSRRLYQPAYYDPRVLSDELLDEYRKSLMVEGLRRAYRGFGAHLDDLSEGRVGVEEVRQRVLVISGEEDAIIPRRALEKMLPSSAKWKVLPKTGHSIAEENPREAARLIEQFLRAP